MIHPDLTAEFHAFTILYPLNKNIFQEVSEEGVLLLVVQLFLQWLGGPKRLPRPSEVLFCSWRGSESKGWSGYATSNLLVTLYKIMMKRDMKVGILIERCTWKQFGQEFWTSFTNRFLFPMLYWAKNKPHLRKAVSMAEVEAFLWRSKQFPELLFVLVEPNHLGFEGKTLVANWLADTSDRSASNQSAVVVILTAPWHLPSSVQQLKLKPDKSVVKKWKKESTTEPHLQLRECWMRVRVTSEVCLCVWNVLSFFVCFVRVKYVYIKSMDTCRPKRLPDWENLAEDRMYASRFLSISLDWLIQVTWSCCVSLILPQWLCTPRSSRVLKGWSLSLYFYSVSGVAIFLFFFPSLQKLR